MIQNRTEDMSVGPGQFLTLLDGDVSRPMLNAGTFVSRSATNVDRNSIL